MKHRVTRILHDNAKLHKAEVASDMITEMGWLPHPTDSRDLSLCDIKQNNIKKKTWLESLSIPDWPLDMKFIKKKNS